MGLKKRKLLYDTEYFPHYYLCTYIPMGAGCDNLSQSLVHFKNGFSPHQQAWTEFAVEVIRHVPELKEAYVIRALSHTERKADAKSHLSISSLTSKVCNAVRGTYIISFLEKTRDINKLSRLNKVERKREVTSAYRFYSPGRDTKHIIVIDDILTSGATIKAIIAAILKECPSVDISIFTLAHTDSTGSNDDVELVGQNYRWIPNDRWVVAEDAPEYEDGLTQLKGYIMNDSFI